MVRRKSRLPKSFTTVTPFSKYLALSLFVILPLALFYLGLRLNLTAQLQSQIIPNDNPSRSIYYKCEKINQNTGYSFYYSSLLKPVTSDCDVLIFPNQQLFSEINVTYLTQESDNQQMEIELNNLKKVIKRPMSIDNHQATYYEGTMDSENISSNKVYVVIKNVKTLMKTTDKGFQKTNGTLVLSLSSNGDDKDFDSKKRAFENLVNSLQFQD